MRGLGKLNVYQTTRPDLYLYCNATFHRGVSVRIARAARRMAGIQRKNHWPHVGRVRD